MTQEQKDRNWKRLCGGKPAPRPVRSDPVENWPKAVMEVYGPELGQSRPRVVFEQKHGVWFFCHWERPLTRLDEWGDTMVGFERMCRHLRYFYRWITPPCDSRSQPGTTATPLSGPLTAGLATSVGTPGDRPSLPGSTPKPPPALVSQPQGQQAA